MDWRELRCPECGKAAGSSPHADLAFVQDPETKMPRGREKVGHQCKSGGLLKGQQGPWAWARTNACRSIRPVMGIGRQ